MSERTLLEPPASSAWPHGEAAAAELRKSLSETQQKRCQRRCRNLRSGHASVDAICPDQVRRAAVRLDAAPQPAASGLSANDAVERHPRAHGGARHYLGEGPQWHGKAARDDR